MSLIFLIGMPAAGKTYWANKLAGIYNLQLTDLDDFLVAKEGIGISEMFARYGQYGFREKEHRALSELIDTDREGDRIIACGGGTPCYNNNMELMKHAGTVVYLKADLDMLLAHLKTDPQNRPMLQNLDDVPAFLEELLQERKNIYEQAHFILPLDNDTVANFEKIYNHV